MDEFPIFDTSIGLIVYPIKHSVEIGYRFFEQLCYRNEYTINMMMGDRYISDEKRQSKIKHIHQDIDIIEISSLPMEDQVKYKELISEQQKRPSSDFIKRN